MAAELGAAAVGVVFAGGPRRLTAARAAQVLSKVPAGVARVGVFVDPDPALVAEAVAACALGWVQLSGRESPEAAERVMDAARSAMARLRPPGLLKAVHVESADTLAGMAGYPADAFLLDAPPVDGRMGGTGRSFAWGEATRLPWDRRRVALAGGLTAENVEAAVAAVGPALVDVSSGVESAPGIKDATRLAAFMAAVRRSGGSTD
jgi:phosphoribosylanthranilate isomerase